jgi:hypothetical protein
MSNPSINLWHGDLFSVGFSNIPTITNIQEINMLEQSVKSVSLPEYGIEGDESVFKGFKIIHPIGPKANIDLTLLNIEFKLLSNLKNYLYLWKWIYNMRHGDVSSQHLRKYWCEAINYNVFDNNKRNVGKFIYTHSFIVNLSALPTIYGSADEVSFNASFQYEKVDWQDS